MLLARNRFNNYNYNNFILQIFVQSLSSRTFKIIYFRRSNKFAINLSPREHRFAISIFALSSDNSNINRRRRTFFSFVRYHARFISSFVHSSEDTDAKTRKGMHRGRRVKSYKRDRRADNGTNTREQRGGAKLSTRPVFLIHEPIPRSSILFSLSFFLFFSPPLLFAHAQRETNINTRARWKIELLINFPTDRKLSVGSIFAWRRERSDMYTIIRPNKFLLPPGLSVMVIISSVFDANPIRYTRIYPKRILSNFIDHKFYFTNRREEMIIIFFLIRLIIIFQRD